MKHMPWLVVACVVGMASLLAGCGIGVPAIRGSGTVASEAREASGGFSAISLAGVGTARVQVAGDGAAESVVVEAEDNLLPLIDTDVRNGRLHIGLKPGASISPTRPIVYHITVAELGAADVSGAGRIDIAGEIKGEKFDARISGSGNMSIEALGVVAVSANISGSGGLSIDRVDATRLACDISGSGNVRVKGRVGDVSFRITGSGSVDAGELESNAASVSISGSGDASVHALERLKSDISGSGSLRYRGSPAALETHVSGSGSVSRVGG